MTRRSESGTTTRKRPSEAVLGRDDHALFPCDQAESPREPTPSNPERLAELIAAIELELAPLAFLAMEPIGPTDIEEPLLPDPLASIIV